MNANLELLKSLIPPPDNAMFADSGWSQVENQLGVPLPADYKEFISVYGSGSLQSFLHIMNLSDSRIAFQEVVSVVFSQLSSYREAGKCGCYKAFPEPGGLLPFASTDDGNYLFWRMDGNPDTWPVAAFDFSSGTIVDAPGVSMVECLLRFVRKDNPFGDCFCNIECFNAPCRFSPWQ